MKNTIMLLLVIGLLCLTGCSGNNYEGHNTITYTAEHDSVDLYLLPATTDANPTTFFENTTYHLWLNGVYTGEWDSSKTNPFNFSINNTNKSLELVPGDELELLVLVDDDDTVPLFIRHILPDRPVDYLVPEIHKVRPYHKIVHVTDSDYYGLENTNWSVNAQEWYEYEFNIYLKGDTIYSILSCEYNFLEVDYVDFFPKTHAVRDMIYPLNYVDNPKTVHYELYRERSPYMIVATKEFVNSTTVYCVLRDVVPYLGRYGNLNIGVMDEWANDVGMDNFEFNITFVKGLEKIVRQR